MKSLRLLLLSLLTAVAAHAADGTPVFNALMTMGKEHRFVLISTSGKASSWLRVGAEFDGYKLKGYDEKTGKLDLERDGKVTGVTIMADAATQSSGSAALTSTPATLSDAEDVLKVMHFEELLGTIAEQQKKAMAPTMQRMMEQVKVAPEDRAAFSAAQQKIMDEMMNAMTGPEMKADLSRIYSGVFSKEELASLGAFYATPAGQAMVAKQPQVQEQMMSAMMPRMMQIGPKFQALAQDYVKERAAKAAGGQPAAPAPKP
jgi:hypothetical protein